MGKCKECSLDFPNVARNKIFCSRNCKEKNRKKRKKIIQKINFSLGNGFTKKTKQIKQEKHCKECKIQITVKRRKVFCSDHCNYLFKAKNKNPNYKPLKRLPDKINCKKCQKLFKPKQSRNLYCSLACANEILHPKREICVCRFCNIEYFPKEYNRVSYCSRDCFYAHRKILKFESAQRKQQEKETKKQLRLIELSIKREKKNQELIERKKEMKEITKSCDCCGNVFKANRNSTKYCSKLCSRKKSNRKRDLIKRKRLKQNGVIDYGVTLEKLLKRDRYKCKLCGNKVNTKCDSNSNDYPSIDHILPVSRGGTHTWGNVQLAHRGCNNKKSNKLFGLSPDGQVAMWI